ncbi:MAG TPA: DNA mismatch repair endonuclease MutL [Thermoanaerobaculia bacterium]|nr:DNA mismatch repair endonuclease MutL [Thermoanaerobaculia bacterium]
MPIRILPSDLVNQIAAGEVVERPASVVKELLENAVDAGARSIELLLEQGGKKLIEIRDDGCGMNGADARLALERHATSKIVTFDDLLAVRTLGFRGEALPSIASVSRFRMVTSDGSSAEATELSVEPGGAVTTRPAARDRGTTVNVGELFENVPARRKFLKSVDAEYRAIIAIVSSYALPSPMQAFRVEHNGRLVLDLPSAPSRRERVLQVLGEEASEALSEVGIEVGVVRADGFVTRGIRYGSRRNQYFFVNGRLVRDRVLTHAASRAAEAFDFDGHPAIVLFLEIPPEQVDVNVHPAKTEVRFRDSGSVHVAVEQGIRMALGGAGEGRGLLRAAGQQHSEIDSLRNGRPLEGGGGHPLSLLRPGSAINLPSVYDATPLFRERAIVQPPLGRSHEQEGAVSGLGALRGRVIGQYRMSYVVIDTPEGLRLVDQHVAHERILYDRFRSRTGDALATQHQLSPVMVSLGAAEAGTLDSHLSELRELGFEIERFSGNSFGVSAAPGELTRDGIEPFLRKLLDGSGDEKSAHGERVRDRIVASLACQAAIKIHRTLSGEEMARLVSELLDASNPYACPHGRPIIVDIRHADIERHFHRR